MLTLFHDYTSPASALAVRRVQRLADEAIPVEFVGFEVMSLDAALPPSLDVLASLNALAADADAEGIVLRRPKLLPPTAPAHAVGTIAEAHDLGASWRERCYSAMWADGEDISDTAVLLRLAEAAGLPVDEIASALQTPAFIASVRRAAGRHRRNGVGGVPTILFQRTLVPGLLSEAQLREMAQY